MDSTAEMRKAIAARKKLTDEKVKAVKTACQENQLVRQGRREEQRQQQ